jgi:hypothetical protein
MNDSDEHEVLQREIICAMFPGTNQFTLLSKCMGFAHTQLFKASIHSKASLK